MTVIHGVNPTLGLEAALASFTMDLEARLEALLELADEGGIDPRWSRATVELRGYCLRKAKRVRPVLVLTGWALASGQRLDAVPEGVRRFAAGLELLHTFMLVHDDVADRAPSRRGGPSLHRILGAGKPGEDLAVVLGDHLYACAVEAMLTAGGPSGAEATRYMMGVCRHTAAGQYLDLDLSRARLDEVTLFQTLKVASLKTARYGFVAPLVTGAMLGGGSRTLLDTLERVGRHAGLAYQLRDDIIGLFGDASVAGKDGGGDFYEGKRTFPVVAAWARADDAGRAELERLWSLPTRTQADLHTARSLVSRWGGVSATEKVVERMTRTARKNTLALPFAHGARDVLDRLLGSLARRAA